MYPNLHPAQKMCTFWRHLYAKECTFSVLGVNSDTKCMQKATKSVQFFLERMECSLHVKLCRYRRFRGAMFLFIIITTIFLFLTFISYDNDEKNNNCKKFQPTLTISELNRHQQQTRTKYFTSFC